jgi:hypothetical protein
MILHAQGAYGRTASEADWDTGKDFRVVGGSYFSKRDTKLLKQQGYNRIVFLGRDRQPAFEVRL